MTLRTSNNNSVDSVALSISLMLLSVVLMIGATWFVDRGRGLYVAFALSQGLAVLACGRACLFAGSRLRIVAIMLLIAIILRISVEVVDIIAYLNSD